MEMKIILFVLFVVGTYAQYCAEWDGKQKMCYQAGNVPGQSWYIQKGETIGSLSVKTTGALKRLVISPHLPGTYHCYQAGLAAICAGYLRKCMSDVGNNSLPVNPDYDIFDFLNQTCLPLLAQKGLEMFLGFGGNYPQEFKPYSHPVTPYFLDVAHYDDERYLVPFFGDTRKQLPGWGNGTTPYDEERGNSTLVLRTDLIQYSSQGAWQTNFTAQCEELGLLTSSDDPLACVFQCPGPPITDDEYNDANIWFVSIAVVSFISCCFTILIYLLVPGSRGFPLFHGIFLCSAGGLADIGLLMAAPDYTELWCGGHKVRLEGVKSEFYPLPDGSYGVSVDLQSLYLHGTGCKFQASFLFIGMLWGVLQWMFLSLENALLSFDIDNKLIRKGLYKLIFWRHVIYQVVSLGIPTIFAIILFSVDRFGYGYATAFCFVTQEDDQAWLLSFWLIPLSIAISLGTIFFFTTIFRILFVLLKEGNRKKVRILWELTWWLGFFTLSTCMIYAFAMAYYIDRARKDDQFKEDLAKFFSCYLLFVDGSDQSTCTYSTDSISYPTMVVQGVNFALMGLVMSVVLLLNGNIWGHFVVFYNILKNSPIKGELPDRRPLRIRTWYHFLPRLPYPFSKEQNLGSEHIKNRDVPVESENEGDELDGHEIVEEEEHPGDDESNKKSEPDNELSGISESESSESESSVDL